LRSLSCHDRRHSTVIFLLVLRLRLYAAGLCRAFSAAPATSAFTPHLLAAHWTFVSLPAVAPLPPAACLPFLPLSLFTILYAYLSLARFTRHRASCCRCAASFAFLCGGFPLGFSACARCAGVLTALMPASWITWFVFFWFCCHGSCWVLLFTAALPALLLSAYLAAACRLLACLRAMPSPLCLLAALPPLCRVLCSSTLHFMRAATHAPRCHHYCLHHRCFHLHTLPRCCLCPLPDNARAITRTYAAPSAYCRTFRACLETAVRRRCCLPAFSGLPRAARFRATCAATILLLPRFASAGFACCPALPSASVPAFLRHLLCRIAFGSAAAVLAHAGIRGAFAL
jgi:hypothetical protein